MSVPFSSTSSVVGQASYRISLVPRRRPPRQRPLTSSTPLNNLAALARGSRGFPPYAATSSSALAGMSPPPRRFGWHSMAKKAARDVDDLRVVLICFL